jgi:hypothetical protein
MTLSAPPPDSDDITNVILTELKWITQETYKDFVTNKLKNHETTIIIGISFEKWN